MMIAKYLVCSFPGTEKGAECAGAEGGIQVVLSIMRSLSEQPSAITSCCTALWSLSVIGQFKHTHTYVRTLLANDT